MKRAMSNSSHKEKLIIGEFSRLWRIQLKNNNKQRKFLFKIQKVNIFDILTFQ